MSASKFGSGLRDRLDTSFFLQVGHSLLPLRSAVIMQSWQNRCKHSFVVIVLLSISRHIGHISSLWRLRGDTAISVLSVIASCGVLWSSYKLNSHVLFGACATSFAILETSVPLIRCACVLDVFSVDTSKFNTTSKRKQSGGSGLENRNDVWSACSS